MIALKSKDEIATLGEGGAILATLLHRLTQEVKPGVTGIYLDTLAQQWIAEEHVQAAFLGYGVPDNKPFPAALCVSVNSAVVHGIPTDNPLQEGDIVSLDLGIIYKGMYLDAARTVAVGEVSPEAQGLMKVTREALRKGIAVAKVGGKVGDIGHTIQEYVEGHGFGVVRSLVGHGVGYDVHEDPPVPNYGRANTGPVLEEGLVIAIEPMVTIGDPDVAFGLDEWTVTTSSGNLAAHEEDTVVVTAEGPKVLTR